MAAMHTSRDGGGGSGPLGVWTAWTAVLGHVSYCPRRSVPAGHWEAPYVAGDPFTRPQALCVDGCVTGHARWTEPSRGTNQLGGRPAPSAARKPPARRPCSAGKGTGPRTGSPAGVPECVAAGKVAEGALGTVLLSRYPQRSKEKCRGLGASLATSEVSRGFQRQGLDMVWLWVCG